MLAFDAGRNAATGWQLNNDGNEVRLVAPGERVVSAVRYEGAASDEVVRFR